MRYSTVFIDKTFDEDGPDFTESNTTRMSMLRESDTEYKREFRHELETKEEFIEHREWMHGETRCSTEHR